MEMLWMDTNTSGTSNNQSFSKKDTSSRVQHLIDLGYHRRDIEVLPNGEVTILFKDEYKSTALTVARVHLEQLTKRRQELEYMAHAHAVEGQPLPQDVEEEYAELRKTISKLEERLAAEDE
jgi:predicted RNA-binding protein associated with RNAse of E/G family